jgi:glyoxylase-like metal-dependent hydrolase (beta-lactamase superfamily II)
MSEPWTRREFLTRTSVAVAAVHSFDAIGPCCALAADAQTANKDLFELKPVADGVYAAIAAPRYKVNSNAAVIVTNDGVIVVDSHSKPSAALALYREIQAITKQPIRKVINTHFHWDHWQGNQVYADATPDLQIIASEQTRANMTDANAGAGGVAYIEKQLETVPQEIAQLKRDIKQAKRGERKRRLAANLAQVEAYLAELRDMKPALPNRTVAQSITLNEGGREVDLLVLGKGHTDGDIFIYLPKEKVVVTGDAVIDWMPFLNDGFPEDWVETLNALDRYDFDKIIPGHGEVAGKEHLAFFRGYLSDLIAAVKIAAGNGASLDEMKATIPDQLSSKYERGMSKYPLGQYRERIGLNIEMVHKKVVLSGS